MRLSTFKATRYEIHRVITHWNCHNTTYMNHDLNLNCSITKTNHHSVPLLYSMIWNTELSQNWLESQQRGTWDIHWRATELPEYHVYLTELPQLSLVWPASAEDNSYLRHNNKHKYDDIFICIRFQNAIGWLLTELMFNSPLLVMQRNRLLISGTFPISR